MWKITTALVSFEKNMTNRKARKIAHKQNELNFLTRKNEINSSEFSGVIVESDEVTETTETVTEKVARMTEKEVKAKMGNKIVFKRNKANRKYHAESGLIDGEFTKWANLTKWLLVSENPKVKGENRIFFNYEKPNGLFIKQAKKAGFEVSFN
tara:strand:+ start:105 stop:563 length:459 start_codon:yes stop_codon:yes gene_type:complete